MANPSVDTLKYNWNDPGAKSLTIGSAIITSGEQLIVFAMGSDGSNNGTTGTVTGIQYGTFNLTKIVDDTNCEGDDGCYSSTWQLTNPPIGTNTVTMTYSGTPAHGVIAAAYSIANGSATIHASNHNGGLTTAGTQTNNVITNVDGCLVIDMFVQATSAGDASVVGTQQTVDYDPYGTTTYAKSPALGSHYTKSPQGTASFSWKPNNTSRGYTWVGIAIAPIVAGAVITVGYRALLGVGV